MTWKTSHQPPTHLDMGERYDEREESKQNDRSVAVEEQSSSKATQSGCCGVGLCGHTKDNNYQGNRGG